MKKLFILFCILFILPLFSCAQVDEENSILVKELKQRLESDSTLVLLDVRRESELTGPLGHIPGVINIPLHEIDDRLDELEEYRGKTIAIICRSGNRSGVATKILINKGLAARNVVGGMRAWNAFRPTD